MLFRSEPNLQNITSEGDSDIRKCYISRFHNGRLVEADFGQLEVVGLAYLSGDRKLKDDINACKDIHSELYYSMYSRYPTKEERKVFKRLTFGLVYGSGATKLAANAGVEIKTARAFIDAFNSRYPDAFNLKHEVLKVVKRSRVVSDKHDPETGMPIGVGEFVNPTGRVLSFREYPTAHSWAAKILKHAPHKTMDFSFTECANYPVQSFATADLVPMVLGNLWRDWLSKDAEWQKNVLLVNTVHDSIMVDCAEGYELQVKEWLTSFMTSVDEQLKELGVNDFDVNVTCEVKSGPNWGTMKTI